ncbi:DUF4224 domain-containing protein [Caballeronia grimmiae]|uniref:DUF4224 domain-containing protein n=1 Tax=Caballeronia grimmiae TaxID=1071679 RepID=UPI0038BDDCA0
MTHAELEEISGLSTNNKQAHWFRAEFRINVVRSSEGRVVMTWTLFESLLARRAGFALSAATPPPERPKLRPVSTDRPRHAQNHE